MNCLARVHVSAFRTASRIAPVNANRTVFRAIRHQHSGPNVQRQSNSKVSHTSLDLNKVRIPGISPSAAEIFDMDAQAGVLAIGYNAIDFGEAVAHFDLKERRAYTNTIGPNPHTREGRLACVALSLRDYDLIATIDDELTHLSLYQFSTGKSHPFASQPSIRLPKFDIPPAGHNRRFDKAQIQICGPRLLIRLGMFVDSGPSKLLVVNWWTGEIIAMRDLGMDEGGSVSFITSDMVLNTSTLSGSLSILRLPSIDKPGRKDIDTILALELPRLKTKVCYTHETTIRCKPDLFGEDHPDKNNVQLKRWVSDAGIACAPENALIKIVLAVEIERKGRGRYFMPRQCDDYQYSLLVHRNALVELVRKHCSYYSRDASTNPDYPTLAWEEWGPSVTHIYQEPKLAMQKNNQIAPLNYSVFGQRVVMAEHDRFILRDFDPRIVGETVVDDATATPAGVVLDHPVDNEIFSNPIGCALPYVETVMKYDNSSYRDVLLGQDGIIATCNDTGTTAIESIDLFTI